MSDKTWAWGLGISEKDVANTIGERHELPRRVYERRPHYGTIRLILTVHPRSSNLFVELKNVHFKACRERFFCSGDSRGPSTYDGDSFHLSVANKELLLRLLWLGHVVVDSGEKEDAEHGN